MFLMMMINDGPNKKTVLEQGLPHGCTSDRKILHSYTGLSVKSTLFFLSPLPTISFKEPLNQSKNIIHYWTLKCNLQCWTVQSKRNKSVRFLHIQQHNNNSTVYLLSYPSVPSNSSIKRVDCITHLWTLRRAGRQTDAGPLISS